jgi:hypothetical protein
MMKFFEVPVKESDLTDSDVVGGKGNGAANRPGNIFYTRLFKAQQSEYQSKSPENTAKNKKRIAQNIINTIKQQDPPGRFLKESKAAFVWTVMNEKKIMEKVMQALREKPKDKKATSSFCETRQLDDNRNSTYNKKRSINHDSSRCLIKRDNLGSPMSVMSSETIDVINPNYRPVKRSIKGDSRRRFFQWANSVSRLDLHVLLNSSIKSIDVDSESAAIHVISQEDVKAGLDEISSDNIDDVVQTSMKPTLVADISTSTFTLEKEESNQDFRKQMLGLANGDINISMANLTLNMNKSDNDLTDAVSESVPVPV